LPSSPARGYNTHCVVTRRRLHQTSPLTCNIPAGSGMTNVAFGSSRGRACTVRELWRADRVQCIFSPTGNASPMLRVCAGVPRFLLSCSRQCGTSPPLSALASTAARCRTPRELPLGRRRAGAHARPARALLLQAAPARRWVGRWTAAGGGRRAARSGRATRSSVPRVHASTAVCSTFRGGG
jgi:hypothetical protein